MFQWWLKSFCDYHNLVASTKFFCQWHRIQFIYFHFHEHEGNLLVIPPTKHNNNKYVQSVKSFTILKDGKAIVSIWFNALLSVSLHGIRLVGWCSHFSSSKKNNNQNILHKCWIYFAINGLIPFLLGLDESTRNSVCFFAFSILNT